MNGEKPQLACPACGSTRSTVKDSGDPLVRLRARWHWKGAGYWRLRECKACHALFTTTETILGTYPPRNAPSA